jgi:hypothetical protein
MKNFLLGFGSAIALFILVPATTGLVSYYYPPKEDSTYEELAIELQCGMYGKFRLFDSITKSCTKDVRKNGHGWVFVVRDYYTCNKLEIAISDLLYGETTEFNREDLRSEVCHECTL